MRTNDSPKIADDYWHLGGLKVQPNSRKRHLKDGTPVYERDRVVEPYKVNKGEWV